MTQLLDTDRPTEPTDVTPAEQPVDAAPVRTASGDEFDYHPTPVLVPIVLVMSLVGLTGLIALPGILVALLTIPLAIWAWWKVRSSEGFYAGRSLALSALGLALVGAIGGITYQRYLYQHEVPKGFERISFNQDVSREPIQQSAFGGTTVSPKIEDLVGEQVFIKGYMYPTKEVSGLRAFLLLKDTGECCFGGDPEVTDMIGVKMKGDLTADHYELQLVSVAGKFRVNRNYGNVETGGSPEPLYMIDAEHFELARTSF